MDPRLAFQGTYKVPSEVSAIYATNNSQVEAVRVLVQEFGLDPNTYDNVTVVA